MRRIIALPVVLLAFVLCGLALVLDSGHPSRAAKVGSPNFVCIAAWNYGICIGPPTKSG